MDPFITNVLGFIVPLVLISVATFGTLKRLPNEVALPISFFFSLLFVSGINKWLVDYAKWHAEVEAILMFVFSSMVFVVKPMQRIMEKINPLFRDSNLTILTKEHTPKS